MSHVHLQPRASRPRLPYNTQTYERCNTLTVLRDWVPFQLFPALGATLQILVVIMARHVPVRIIAPLLHFTWLLPVVLFLSATVPDLVQLAFPRLNPRLSASVQGRYASVLPGDDGQSPELGILVIGARSHRPFPLFDGEFRRIAKVFAQMWRELELDPNSGLLSAESYLSTSSFSRNAVMTIGYFRTATHAQKFARHASTHTRAWRAYLDLRNDRRKYLEIWHELFDVKRGGTEGIYVNTIPRGLGAIWHQVERREHKGHTGGEKATGAEADLVWQSTLKPALGRFERSKARMRGQVDDD